MFESERISLKTLLIGFASFIILTLLLTFAIEAIGAERLRALVADAGTFAPLLYLVIRAVTFIIAPLSSGPLGFSAGVLFGLWPGLLLTLAGEVIGGSANFWIARRFGRGVVTRFVGREGMGKVERFYEQASHPLMLVYARLFLFAIYDFISYAAGLTNLKYRHYLLVTVVAGLAPTGIAVGIGASLTGNPEQLIVLYIALAVIFTATFLLYGRVRRWLKLDGALAVHHES